MDNLSHGVCKYHLIINSHNVQFTYRPHAAPLLSKWGMSAGHSRGTQRRSVMGQDISTDFCFPRVWVPDKILDVQLNLNFR